MTTNTTSLNTITRGVIRAAVIGTGAALFALPVFAYATSYAYVNQAGEVMMTEAATPQSALMTAPSIDEHSGVMLLSSPSDTIVGDSVSGV